MYENSSFQFVLEKRAPGRFDISIEYEDEILTNVCQNSKVRFDPS